MKNPHYIATVALGLAGVSGHAWATPPDNPASSGIMEIGDAELAQMRGRWTPPGTPGAVAYFGVTMSSTWNASGGQQLASSMSLGMNFDSSGNVQVTFLPTLTIVQATSPGNGGAPVASAGNHTVDSSGLYNASGLVQGVQVAGDGNIADNVTSLTLATSGDRVEPAGGGIAYDGQPQTFSAHDGDASASTSISSQGMQVSLTIAGQGQVQQWINSSSLGQVIALGSDGQSVHNRLQIQLVQRPLATSVNLSRDLAQSMNLVRGIGMAY